MNKYDDPAILDINMVVSHVMRCLFGMSKNNVNGCLISYNYISFEGLIHHLTSKPGSYHRIPIMESIILGYYLLETNKSILGIMDGRALSILNQIDIKASPTIKLVASVVLMDVSDVP